MRQRGQLMGERDGSRERLAGFDHAVDEADPLGLDAVDPPPGEDEVDRPTVPDQPGQANRAEVDQGHPEPAAVDPERGVARRHPQVAPQRQLEPARHRGALDRRDHRFAEAQPGRSHRPRAVVPDRAAVAGEERLEVGAGAEVPTGSRQHGHGERLIGVELEERVEQARALAASTALRRSGRLIVTTRTPPSSATWTGSVVIALFYSRVPADCATVKRLFCPVCAHEGVLRLAAVRPLPHRAGDGRRAGRGGRRCRRGDRAAVRAPADVGLQLAHRRHRRRRPLVPELRSRRRRRSCRGRPHGPVPGRPAPGAAPTHHARRAMGSVAGPRLHVPIDGRRRHRHDRSRGGEITLDLDEADFARQEEIRSTLGELYRTPLGHVRHELGHVVWLELVAPDAARLAEFRAGSATRPPITPGPSNGTTGASTTAGGATSRFARSKFVHDFVTLRLIAKATALSSFGRRMVGPSKTRWFRSADKSPKGSPGANAGAFTDLDCRCAPCDVEEADEVDEVGRNVLPGARVAVWPNFRGRVWDPAAAEAAAPAMEAARLCGPRQRCKQ